jgi:AmmeMemoRadiSam system protein A
VIALGYSFLSSEDHLRFGNCVRAAIEKLGRRVAFIASGDLSHRLQPGAPAGYNPDAHLFDEEVVDAIRSCATSRIVDIDQEQRRNAGECGYRSMLVAFGVVEGRPASCEVISYEAPFGVGYLVAQLLSAGTDTLAVASGSIPMLARRTIETFVTTREVIRAPGPPATAGGSDKPDHLSDLIAARAGCFVSIKTLDGDLRGCIGTIDPVKDTLAEEVITNAISAATHDPRFSPVKKDELPNLKYSVDVLSAPEPCSVDDLDPQIYGVIVEDESGLRRGLLLPNLEGINTAAQQIEIASRKAGIASGTPIKLFRFRAERYSES